MSQNTFCMAGGVARNPLVRLAKPITATIGANEHIAIVGPNGGGKSLFVDTKFGRTTAEIDQRSCFDASIKARTCKTEQCLFFIREQRDGDSAVLLDRLLGAFAVLCVAKHRSREDTHCIRGEIGGALDLLT